MGYMVPGMTLIPQTQTMSCWYASAQMLINWKQEQKQASLLGLIPPDLDAECAKIRDSNSGLTNPQILTMAKRLGLRAVPPMSPTPQAIENWLRQYGPLWVNGISHIVVIAGITKNARATNNYYDSYTVKVYNPAPLSIGRIEMLGLGSWYTGNTSSSRDTSAAVEAVFLYCPDSW